MAGVMARPGHDDFRKKAEDFKRCLRAMGYVDVKVDFPLDVLENKELKTTFVIDYGEGPAPSPMNIRMNAKGVWTNIYKPYPAERMERAGTERLYDETGEPAMCEQCGCIDFVKKGDEYACAVCCKSSTG